MTSGGVAAEPSGASPTIMERLLGGIERVGNKVPHPAILFIALIGIVIVLSQILYWANVSVSYETIKPPAAVVEQQYVGGSAYPAEVLPAEAADSHACRSNVDGKTSQVYATLAAARSDSFGVCVDRRWTGMSSSRAGPPPS